jgi:hypothetical protein
MTIQSIGLEMRKQFEGVKFDDHDSFVHHLEKVKKVAAPGKFKLLKALKEKIRVADCSGNNSTGAPSSLNLTKSNLPPSSNISTARY